MQFLAYFYICKHLDIGWESWPLYFNCLPDIFWLLVFSGCSLGGRVWSAACYCGDSGHTHLLFFRLMTYLISVQTLAKSWSNDRTCGITVFKLSFLVVPGRCSNEYNIFSMQTWNRQTHQNQQKVNYTSLCLTAPFICMVKNMHPCHLVADIWKVPSYIL